MADRVIFTKQMKKDYTILIPNMLPVHFRLLQRVFWKHGYNAELLTTSHRGIVDEGLKNVHNDTCYPALLVIGQFIDALKSGKYDKNKVALMITQTGGGCRASNYINLLRKALKKSGLEYVPVISLNLAGLEKNPGFKLNFKLLSELIFALLYGDILMHLSQCVKPYEKIKGSCDKLTEEWVHKLYEQFKKGKRICQKTYRENAIKITESFAKIEVNNENKIKVGIVGEIYVKFAPLGNNDLEEFLLKEGAQPVMYGLLDFILYTCDAMVEDRRLFGSGIIKATVAKWLRKYMVNCQNIMLEVLKPYERFNTLTEFFHKKELVKGYVGIGNKMGEGWLLISEMLELIESGVPNIVCTQPFGCLPNHIIGKGMIKKLRDNYPQSNIVAIDYDPGATKANQENRIKLMLANARETQQTEKTTDMENVNAFKKS
ncbi:MAG: 2-hydroxyglutaryl-CoA dehydratase [Ruminococcaceae bacterium]|nr:2-hydroxyglutaryl-CoA dehydratase [Oscillospiraceae bacterium]